ncbi:hypothetical protein BJX66DRAFT_303425 [Aspergillus keveii]|uniref:Uncharacterized protein n=1 Tax=Aspergillus keveii TaxID=714993 RepID=A0ABR4G7B6_9EURO
MRISPCLCCCHEKPYHQRPYPSVIYSMLFAIQLVGCTAARLRRIYESDLPFSCSRALSLSLADAGAGGQTLASRFPNHNLVNAKT